MLLDENEERSILVTQPRRVAATSLARRVAQQRGVTLGTEVGFKIGGLVVAMEGVRSLGQIHLVSHHPWKLIGALLSNRGEMLAFHPIGFIIKWDPPILQGSKEWSFWGISL